MKRSVIGFLFLGFVFLTPGQAKADINFDFTGNIESSSPYGLDLGSTHYDMYWLNLSMNSDPVTVNSGDTINATVTLDKPLTIPASVSYTYLGLYLTTSTGYYPNIKTSAIGGTIDFYNQSTVPFMTESLNDTGTESQIVPSIVFNPPANGTITFDSLKYTGSLAQLTDVSDPDNPEASSLYIDGGMLHYQLTHNDANSVVPEPSTLFLFGIAGLGLLGLKKFKIFV